MLDRGHFYKRVDEPRRAEKNSEKLRLARQSPCPHPGKGRCTKPPLTEGGKDAVEPVDEKHGAEFLFLGGAKR